MDAFDADIVIYVSKGDPRGDVLAQALSDSPEGPAGFGSTLLFTEILVPGVDDESRPRVESVLRGLALLPVDGRTARTAAVLRGLYGLRTPDAVHLATAINSGANRFVTGNRRDFSRVREIELLHP